MCSQEQADEWWADNSGADGVCDKDELSKFLLSENIGQDVIDQMFQKFDADNSGTISKAEYYLAVLPKEKRCVAMKRFFNEMDTDGNGRLSSEEIAERCSLIGKDAEQQRALKQVMEDAGSDGMDAQEFADFMNRF